MDRGNLRLPYDSQHLAQFQQSQQSQHTLRSLTTTANMSQPPSGLSLWAQVEVDHPPLDTTEPDDLRPVTEAEMHAVFEILNEVNGSTDNLNNSDDEVPFTDLWREIQPSHLQHVTTPGTYEKI